MKIAIIILILGLVVVGCAPGQSPIQIQVDSDSQEVIAKIAARHIGDELEKRYPAIATEVLALSEKILAAEKNDAVVTAFDKIVFVLTSKISDPLLAMDIRDLTDLIKIEIGITEEQMGLVMAVAKGLISGIKK
ncbi:hypothetical protein KAU11_00175 [Candidatus Babeliales bacterium]|nr:hypothetical protein [Candidatus Babeliales bacterium]